MCVCVYTVYVHLCACEMFIYVHERTFVHVNVYVCSVCECMYLNALKCVCYWIKLWVNRVKYCYVSFYSSFESPFIK